MSNICTQKIGYTDNMLTMRFLSIIFVLFFSFAIHASAHATFVSGAKERVTRRQVQRTATYIHSLDEHNRRNGIVRKRSTESDNTTKSYDRLRKPTVRRVRQSSTISSSSARSPLSYSPTLNKRMQPSILSLTPVSIETEALYRNGIKYFTGEDRRQDSIFSFMWLSFALADGHPFAREALVIVSRTLNPSQLEEARYRTKILSSEFLNGSVDRNSLIKDRLREQDLERIHSALRQYWRRHGRYPVFVPKMRAIEICNLDAATCDDRLNLMDMVPDFILTIPSDPNAKVGGNGTGYYILEQKDGSLLLFSAFSESTFVVVSGK